MQDIDDDGSSKGDTAPLLPPSYHPPTPIPGPMSSGANVVEMQPMSNLQPLQVPSQMQQANDHLCLIVALVFACCLLTNGIGVISLIPALICSAMV